MRALVVSALASVVSSVAVVSFVVDVVVARFDRRGDDDAHPLFASWLSLYDTTPKRS